MKHTEEKGTQYKWKSATSINTESTESKQDCKNASSESAFSKAKSEAKSFLTPSMPYFPMRRGSSPLVAELSALREADQRDKNVVVFPNRKVEDVPGIFIPKPQTSTVTSTSKMPQFLSVNEHSAKNRRRHSLSDPAIFQLQSQKSRPTWLTNLTPRSAYANFTSQDRLRYTLELSNSISFIIYVCSDMCISKRRVVEKFEELYFLRPIDNIIVRF